MVIPAVTMDAQQRAAFIRAVEAAVLAVLFVGALMLAVGIAGLAVGVIVFTLLLLYYWLQA